MALASGADNPDTLNAFSHLIDVCIRLKSWELAEGSYKHLLPALQRSLGPEDTTVLHHLEQQAIVFLRLGRVSEAKAQLHRVQEIKERISGSDHPDLITCLNGLAQVALAEKEYSTGLTLLTRAQQIAAQQSSPDPLQLAALLDTAAAIAQAQQLFEKATNLYKQALEFSIRVLGEKEPELIDPLEHLAQAYSKQHEYQQARQYLLQALAIYQETERPEDMLLDPVLNSLADLELACEHPALARSYLDRSRAIRELALGEHDPRTLEIIQKVKHIPNTFS